MAAVETVDLHRRFGALQVLTSLTLSVEEGEVYGLLGPNGAGKTTLLHLLLGFLRPDGGQARVLGARPGAALARVGYLPERVRYHAHFGAREYLRALGAIGGLRGKTLAERCAFALELVGLAGAADRRVGSFSKGMLQRLGIAQAIVHDPDLLLVDEPTSGLDLAGQREVIGLLAELRRRGHTILMCTHQIAEVEELCDRVGVLAGGRLAAQARVGELARARGVRIVAADELPEAVVEGLRFLGPEVRADGLEIRVGPGEALQRRVLRVLLDAEVTVAELRPVGSGVEELYQSVVGPRTD